MNNIMYYNLSFKTGTIFVTHSPQTLPTANDTTDLSIKAANKVAFYPII